MARLLLSEDGVFPIIKDAKGNLLNEKPNTSLSLAGTIQGEGKLAGVPSLFIRLAGCNLKCEWFLPDGSSSICDTSYASDGTGVSTWFDVEEIFDIITNNCYNITHLVITGGEPMLQRESLVDLCKLIKDKTNFHITIETNGTIWDDKLAKYIDLFSVSPKLKNARYVKSGAYPEYKVQNFINHVRVSKYKSLQLKFVVSNLNEESKIESFLSELSSWTNEDILIMPAGCNENMLKQSSPAALELSIKHNWRFAPRLQINLFGEKKRV